MKHTNKKGFTIVELVIVIAVIAILAAVLIPNLSRLVTKADKSAAMQEAKAAMDNDLINAEGDLANMEKYKGTVDGKTVQYYVVREFTTGTEIAEAEGEKMATITADGTVTIVLSAATSGKTYVVHAYDGIYSTANESYTVVKDGFTCTFVKGEWNIPDKK